MTTMTTKNTIKDYNNHNDYNNYNEIFPKLGDADIFRLEMAVFRCFFGLNKFSLPNGRLSPIACHTCLESLCISGQI